MAVARFWSDIGIIVGNGLDQGAGSVANLECVARAGYRGNSCSAPLCIVGHEDRFML